MNAAPTAPVVANPTLTSDGARYGVAVTQVEYPAGVGGVKLSLVEMSRRIYDGIRSPSIRQFAEMVVRNWAKVPASQQLTNRQAAQIFLDYIRSNVRYRPDPHNTELTQSAAITLCVPGAAICIPVEDCFPQGTLLLRDDYTFVPVEEIRVGDRIWGKDDWTTVEATAFKGRLSVDAVEMNNGSTMYLTPDHKVYAGRCRHDRGAECTTCHASIRKEKFVRVPVGDLGEGEVLLQPERVSFGKGSVDADRMYVEALCLADGWVRDNCKCFYVSGKDGHRKESQKHDVKAICERLGIETRWHKRYIVIYDESWARRIAELGERARFKQLETIDLDEKTAEAALRGLMADSTPSSVRIPNGARTYSTTSPMLRLQVRLLQRMFGVSMSEKMLTPAQHRGAGKHHLWRLAERKPEDGRQEKTLTVKSIERSVRKLPCWDIQTSDHYVYLPEHDVTVSNCDGLTVAFDSLAGAYGIPVKILHQVFGSSDQEHVLGLIQDDSGDWLPADPSASSDKPVGWKSSAATRENVIDPLDPATIQRVGTNEAEFIGIGGFALHRMRPRSVGRLLGVGFIAPADVNALMQQLDPQMDSLDAVFRTCTGLSSDDLSAWSGFYASWNALVARWRTFTNAPWWQPWLIVDAVWIASDTLTQMQGYSTALASWQAKAKTVCTYSPPPAPVVQPPQLTPSTAVDDIAKAAGAITGVIVAGTAAYLVIDAVGWLNVLKPHRAPNPVRRRRRRR